MAVHATSEARGGSRREHAGGLLRVEGTRLAEHVDPAHVRGDRLQHVPHDEVHVSLCTARVLLGHEVRAEEGHLVDLPVPGESVEQARGAGLLGDGEAVAGLRLEGRGAARGGLRDPRAHEREEPLVARGARRGGRDGDAARGVGLPRHAGLELGGAVPVEDEMSMGVDPAGEHGPAAEVLAGIRRGDRGGGAGPGDAAVLDHEGGVAEHLAGGGAALPRLLEGRVEGPELADAGEQGAGHASSQRGLMASWSSRATSPRR